MPAKRTPKTARSTQTQSDRSKLRLSEVARHVIYPPGIVTTEWPRVEAKCRDMGVEFDEWQKGLGRIALGKTADGKYAATRGGVVLSIPRQVGKTYTIGNIIIALCLLHPNTTVLWTAQRVRTSTMTFESMQGMVRRQKIKPFLKGGTRNDGIRTANGEQEIRFRNGSVIMFGSRDNGFGRGFTNVDAEVFDEAQMLKSKALDDMVPATNQSRLAGGALLFFMGTPPRPLDLGDEFRARRKKALSGKWKTGVYVEMSADRGATRGDRDQVMMANPSVPHRTPWESIDRMDEQLTDDDAYFHEALGIWDDDEAQAAFPMSDWTSCFSEWAVGRMKVAGLSLAVSHDMDWSTVFVAAKDGETVHVRPVAHKAGTAWAIEALKRAQERESLPVIIDPKSPADAMIPVLEREGVELRTVTTDEAYTACSSADRLVREHRLRHASYDVLNDGVRTGRRRYMRNGRWLWERKSGIDGSALEAMTLAAFQAENPNDKPKYPPGDIF